MCVSECRGVCVCGALCAVIERRCVVSVVCVCACECVCL